jgi:transposase
MEHVAIDLGGRESQICVRRSDGTIIEEVRWATKGLAEYLGRRPKSRVVVETCAEAFVVADAARAAGHEVRVVPSTLVRALGVGARRIKNDKKDARATSEASCRIDLPSVHIPSAEARQRKAVCALRDALVAARTQLANSVRGWARGHGQSIRRGGVETFPARVRQSCGSLPAAVERQLRVVEKLNEEIAQADREVVELATADPVCRRLQTVPGVGPVTAVRFVATLDDVRRFENAHQVESYIGLVPGESSSSERQHRLSITKAGSARLRHTLVQGAWAARLSRARHPMVEWSYEVEKRRGKRVAAVALARKMAGILYAIWRDGSVYDPRRGARPVTPTTVEVLRLEDYKRLTEEPMG